MPGTARAPRQRPRAQAARRPDDPVFEVAKQMRLPMTEIAAILRALALMGHGMTEQGHDDGCAVVTLAAAAAERLAVIDDLCLDLIQIARG